VVLAEGCIVEPAVFSNARARFTMELAPGARAQVQGPESAANLRYGQRVEVEARFRTPHNFQNPGAFDYAAYLARRDTYWTAIVPAKGAVRVLPGECGSRWRGWVFTLRAAALDRIEQLYPNDGYAAAMLKAVLIGESANLERVWTEDFRRSGTYHALVISGVHVSVLAGVFLALLRWAPISRDSALALTAVVAWTYALVSGFTVPVVRAAAGFTLYLVAQLVFRRVRPLNLLSAIAIVYLAWDPLQLFEASFQLSFLSVAAIAAFAVPILEKTTAPLSQGLRDVGQTGADPHLDPRAAQLRVELRLAAETIHLWLLRVPTRFAVRGLAMGARVGLFAFELSVVSACIQAGLALPMAEYFHRVSFTGLSANVVIVPLMNLLVPVGFAAIFTGWGWLAWCADTLLRWSAAVAQWHAVREPEWRVPDPPLWLALALAGMVVAGAVLMRRNRLRWPAMATVAGLIALLVVSPWAAAVEPGELEMTAIDVGQGDSLLLVFPQGATMLIDGGGRLEYGPQTKGTNRRGNLDIGEDVVSTYLWTRGIRHIDVIAATHAHQDHTGGLHALIENFHPAELWVGANPLDELIGFARRQGVQVVQRQATGEFTFSGAAMEVLAPAADYVPISPGNNDSLVLRVRYGSRAFLLMGDLERAEEQRLLASGRTLAADVLKVGHHGSRTSTTQAFLDAVGPSVAVISVGYENSFGHPHPDVMARLQARHAAILRTDRAGLVTVWTDGRRLGFDQQAWREPMQLLEFPGGVSVWP
jgi:competence protein ComEC